MSALERPSSALAALTDKEREILRLLAAGHTVKSIAVRLERSEPSINERLRDARRKTGVGSSRELARLLDAQKNWDKKIDLSTQRSKTDEDLQRPGKRRLKSKGTIIMLIAISAAAAGLMFAASDSMHQTAAPQAPQAAHSSAHQRMPLAGSWSLDVGRIPAEERPRRVTVQFRVSQDQTWTTKVEIVGPDGTSQHAESTAALDGVPVPVAGNMAAIDSVSLRQPSPNTLVMTLGKNGVPVSTRVYAVASDEKSMTETIIWAGNSIPTLESTYFNRIN